MKPGTPRLEALKRWILEPWKPVRAGTAPVLPRASHWHEKELFMTPRASSQTLTDHDEIQRWAEERGARPSCVRNTGGGNDIGMIRLDFPGYSGADSLEEISWDDWFEKFDDNNLALVVQNETARGQKSNFNKLVGRDTMQERARSGRRVSRHKPAGRSRTSAQARSSQSGAGSGRSRSSRRSSGSRSSASKSSSSTSSARRSSSTARSKRGTSARGARSRSRRGGARVTSISSARSRRTQGRASGRTSRKAGNSRRRAA